MRLGRRTRFVFLSALVMAAVWAYRTKITLLRAESEKLKRANGQLTVLLQGFRKGEPDPSKFRAENNLLAPPSSAKERVVFMGDSITRGWDIEGDFNGLPLEMINRAVSGERTAQMLARFQEDVLSLRPAVIILTAGTNDIYHRVEPRFVIGNLAAMIQMARVSGARVVAGAIPPMKKDVAVDHGAIAAVNTWLREYCAAGRCSFADFHAALSRDGTWNAELFSDSLHPNPSGYRKMARRVRAALRFAK